MENQEFAVGDSSNSTVQQHETDELPPVQELNDTSFCDISALEDDHSEISNSSEREIAEFLMRESGLYPLLVLV